ncbi:carboxypeptidase-like regulatory domain-containing protein [Candidatus Entotheonella palauensis]|uniref:Carboxypeptidase regulatory-like domain-containing protein n=1 Tax=Candidatus Entotheonella gemina TaxID=1429439 RepID=W4MFB8_9BACT|nr:carboxypeptidase-like regulatory domain-containing protein [Candidatus Entotheonella palauensis]ETX08898.1 MAG: hypothetical protein ETSY2_02675 [Candidatus Entotheonella gemina]
MLFTKVTLHQRLQCRWPRQWSLWCLACLIMSWVPFAWSQVPMPEPLPPPLFGAQVEGVAATSDAVVDFTLESGSVLSGRVLDMNGVEVVSATVLAQSDTEVFRSSIIFHFDPDNPTLPEFRYRIVLPDGTYQMFVRMIVIDTAATPSQLLSIITFDLQETVVVAGDTERDLTVPESPPFLTLTGQVVSLGLLPSEGSLIFQSEDGRIANIAQAEIPDGATQATYSVTLPAGTYHVAFIVTLPESPVPDMDNPIPPPPPDPEVPQQAVLIPVGTVTVNADQVFDINVPDVVSLAGKLEDGSGMALAGATIFAGSGLPQAPPPPLSTRVFCQTDSLMASPIAAGSSASLPMGNTLGDYELPVVPGDYQVSVAAPVELMPPASMLTPQQGTLTFPVPSEMMTIMMDQTRDFTLPLLPDAVRISGRVMDQQNQPVSNAYVSAVSSMVTAAPNVLFSNGVETNEMGEYQLLVLSGVDYTVMVCPPEPDSLIDVPMP